MLWIKYIFINGLASLITEMLMNFVSVSGWSPISAHFVPASCFFCVSIRNFNVINPHQWLATTFPEEITNMRVNSKWTYRRNSRFHCLLRWGFVSSAFRCCNTINIGLANWHSFERREVAEKYISRSLCTSLIMAIRCLVISSTAFTVRLWRCACLGD